MDDRFSDDQGQMMGNPLPYGVDVQATKSQQIALAPERSIMERILLPRLLCFLHSQSIDEDDDMDAPYHVADVSKVSRSLIVFGILVS